MEVTKKIVNLQRMDKSKHLEFISRCKKAAINGGRKRTYEEVLIREVEKGNPKAIEIAKDYKLI